MYQVTKRDGQIVDFNLSKISLAIEKAFKAQEKEYNQDIIDLLALKVTADFEPKIKNSLIQVEDIQDSVERGPGSKRATPMWRRHTSFTGSSGRRSAIMKSTMLDYKEIVDSYVKVDGLAGEGEFHRHLFRRRSDLKQFRRDHSKLLAV